MERKIQGGRLFLLALGISIAAFLVSLDGMIVNVAVPTISGDFGVREDAGTWIITVFTMASTLTVPLSGWLSGRFGSIPLFVFSTLMFSAISFLCGLTRHFEYLLLLRVFQGVFAGILTPLSLSLIVQSFPEERRGVAVGFWGFFVMVGPAMGPMIGGWLSDSHWPWMFFMNLPLGILSTAIILVVLQEHKEERMRAPLDWQGVILLFVSLGCFQVAVNRGNIDDWFRSPFIVTLFIIGAVTLIFFIAWEIFHPFPFIIFRYFRRLNFSLGVFTTAVAMALIFSSFILDTLWVHQNLGYTPAWAGLTLAPVGFFPLIMYPIMGRIVSYVDIRIWVGGSFLLYAATFFWLSYINLDVPFLYLVIPRLIQGIGFAMFSIPNALMAMQGVPKEQLIYAVSQFAFMRMLFVGFAISLSVNLWFHREAYYQTIKTQETFAGNPPFESFLAPFETLDINQTQVTSLANDFIVSDSWTLGLADIYYLFGWLFLALTLAALFYKVPKKKALETVSN